MIENPRLRLLVGRRGKQLAVALAVVGVVAFVGAGWVAASTPTNTVTQQAHEQSVTTTTSTEAVVTGSDSLWPPGTVLSDNPVYLFNATPSMTVTATTTVTGTDSVEATHEWRVTVKASRDGEVFYSQTQTLTNNTGTGKAVTTNATVDVESIARQVKQIQQRIGTAGVITAELSLVTAYDTGRYQNEETTTAPLTIGSKSYALGDGLGGSSEHSETVQTEVRQPPDSTSLAGLSTVGVVSMVLAVVIIRQDPEEIDVEKAKVDLHRRQYAQWISPGRIPMGTQKEFIELDSLEALVDAAIDTEERVVHDERRDLYAAFSENVVYYYSPGGDWMETVFPRLDTGGDSTPAPPSGGVAESGGVAGPGGEPQDEMFGMGEDIFPDEDDDGGASEEK